MKLSQWLIMYDPVSLKLLNPGVPMHPRHEELVALLSLAGWIIDLDMRSPSGAWVSLMGLFRGKGFYKDTSNIDSVIDIIGDDPHSFLEISPADSLHQSIIDRILEFNFTLENNFGLMVMRWYKK